MSGKVVLEYHNRNAQRKAVYAGYEIFGGDESISKAEEAYRKSWDIASAICEAADVFPTKIKMIIHMPFCEGDTNVVPVTSYELVDGVLTPKQIGFEHLKSKAKPGEAMSVGWRVDLTAEEEERVGDAYNEYKMCSAKEENNHE